MFLDGCGPDVLGVIELLIIESDKPHVVKQASYLKDLYMDGGLDKLNEKFDSLPRGILKYLNDFIVPRAPEKKVAANPSSPETKVPEELSPPVTKKEFVPPQLDGDQMSVYL